MKLIGSNLQQLLKSTKEKLRCLIKNYPPISFRNWTPHTHSFFNVHLITDWVINVAYFVKYQSNEKKYLWVDNNKVYQLCSVYIMKQSIEKWYSNRFLITHIWTKTFYNCTWLKHARTERGINKLCTYLLPKK